MRTGWRDGFAERFIAVSVQAKRIKNKERNSSERGRNKRVNTGAFLGNRLSVPARAFRIFLEMGRNAY